MITSCLRKSCDICLPLGAFSERANWENSNEVDPLNKLQVTFLLGYQVTLLLGYKLYLLLGYISTLTHKFAQVHCHLNYPQSH